jgi:hypothetical protein
MGEWMTRLAHMPIQYMMSLLPQKPGCAIR